MRTAVFAIIALLALAAVGWAVRAFVIKPRLKEQRRNRRPAHFKLHEKGAEEPLE